MLKTRIPLLVMLVGLLAAGAVQVNLVAQEGETSVAEGASRITVEVAKEFSAKLATEDDLHKQLRAALQSEAGALALRDRAGHYEAEAREDAREEAIPQLINTLFDKTGAKLNLRPEKQAFRDEYLAAAEKVNADINLMTQALQDVAAKMKPESELEKVVHRFMTNETAPIILYVRQLRPRLRPGVKVLEKLLEGTFALRRDGKYAIRPDARPQAEERAKQFAAFEKFFNSFQGDVADLAAEISKQDEFHKKLSATFREPLFTARLGAELVEDGRPSRSRAERIIGQLEGALREGADGLVVREEERAEVEKFITEYEQIKQAVTRMRKPLQEFATRVADDDELNRTWKKLLQTDVALIRIAGRIEYSTADAGDAVKDFLAQILSEQDDGTVRVQPTEVDEAELIEGISEMFRQSRSARRRGRELDAITDAIADTQLRATLQSAGGKVVFADYLNQHLAGLVEDGFEQWVAEHFEKSENGFQIRDDAAEAIRQLIEQVEDIKRELDNADF